jgi:hypothetical protein
MSERELLAIMAAIIFAGPEQPKAVNAVKQAAQILEAVQEYQGVKS